MRAIERKMIAAIREHKDWRLDNTEVEWISEDVASVMLHGHTLAEVHPDHLMISDCGWQTTTTKSRLNALLGELVNVPTGISQKNWTWRLCTPDATIELDSGSIHNVAR